jgi:DeoR/GlpR family transcriptional regulator of sugar metabolism
LDGGLTDVYLTEVEVNRYIVKRAQTVIAIVDGSKFGRLGLASFVPTVRIDTLVTDSSAPAEMIEKLRRRGVEVLTATGEKHIETRIVA